MLGTIILVERHEGRDYQTRWSPYYLIQVSPFGSIGYDIKVNRDSHQQALDLSGRFDDRPIARSRKILYDLPYRFVDAERVLVIGAGTGTTLPQRCGVSPNAQIDAVEITPRSWISAEASTRSTPSDNPTRPSAYRRRTSISELKRIERYDAIIFGFLDSRTAVLGACRACASTTTSARHEHREGPERLTPTRNRCTDLHGARKVDADRLFGSGPCVRTPPTRLRG